MSGTSSKRTFDFAAGIDVRGTVRGVKNPVMVGPTEVWWNTRTPDGVGSLHMKRLADSQMAAEAWGPGAEWLLHQAPLLLGSEDNLEGFVPPDVLRDYWLRNKFLLGRTDRPWDSIVGGILGQKVQATLAHRSRRALARKFGDPAPGPNGGWILPGPDVVAQMAYHDFHQLEVERKRAEIIIRVAKEMRRVPNLTQTRTPTQVRTRLEHIRGIGPWTSNLVTAAAMGDADAVPVGDYHIPNTMCWLLAGEARGTDERMLELLEPYAGHRWRIIRMGKATGGAPKFGPRLALSADGIHLGT